MSELKLTLFLYKPAFLYLGLVLKLEFSRKNMNTGRSKGRDLPQAHPKSLEGSPRATLIHSESPRGPDGGTCLPLRPIPQRAPVPDKSYPLKGQIHKWAPFPSEPALLPMPSVDSRRHPRLCVSGDRNPGIIASPSCPLWTSGSHRPPHTADFVLTSFSTSVLFTSPLARLHQSGLHLLSHLCPPNRSLRF